MIGYFLPTVVAYSNKKNNKGSVTVINIFLGWTVIGWIIALAMAVSKDHEPHTVVISKDNISDAHELERLAELKNKGVLTEEEFALKKKQILES